MSRMKWTIEIEVDELWVADGFNLTNSNVADVVAHVLPFAYGHEFGARVLAGPPEEEVARAQGYKSVAEFRKAKR